MIASALLLLQIAAAQASPATPIRTVRIIAESDTQIVRSVFSAHVRPNGTIVVSDTARNRIILLDSSLKGFKVVAAEGTRQGFGGRPGMLIPYAGDSTALVDRDSKGLVIIDSTGRFGRVFAAPKAIDLINLNRPFNGLPTFDEAGNVYYRALPGASAPVILTGDTIISSPESVPVVRASFELRRVDTIASVRIPRIVQRSRRIAGNMSTTFLFNPMPLVDEWTVFPNGTVAVVRGDDYHIDWYDADGRARASPKLPFDWRRLTDDERRTIADSVQRLADSASNRSAVDRGIRTDWIRSGVVPPEELPEYAPAIRVGSQPHIDSRGRLWIMPATSRLSNRGMVYDVVTTEGAIVERVILPEGRVILGFDARGVIVMLHQGVRVPSRIERAILLPN